MTEIYLHIVARMADYMDTHPYASEEHTRMVDYSLAGGGRGCGGGSTGAAHDHRLQRRRKPAIPTNGKAKKKPSTGAWPINRPRITMHD